MILVKLNKCNFAFDKECNQVTNFDKQDPVKFQFRLLDGSMLEIPIEKCTRIIGGYYKSEYDGQEYIFDDGYRYESIMLGYLVYRNYDEEIITDKEFGVNLRNDLYDKICQINGLYSNTMEVTIYDETYIVTIDKINSIVTKNQQRKEAGKKIFPFIKSMDKFGTFYVSIFSKSRDEIRIKLDSATIINDILARLNDDLSNSWKFVKKDHTRIPLYI